MDSINSKLDSLIQNLQKHETNSHSNSQTTQITMNSSHGGHHNNKRSRPDETYQQGFNDANDIISANKQLTKLGEILAKTNKIKFTRMNETLCLNFRNFDLFLTSKKSVNDKKIEFLDFSGIDEDEPVVAQPSPATARATKKVSSKNSQDSEDNNASLTAHAQNIALQIGLANLAKIQNQLNLKQQQENLEFTKSQPKVSPPKSEAQVQLVKKFKPEPPPKTELKMLSDDDNDVEPIPLPSLVLSAPSVPANQNQGPSSCTVHNCKLCQYALIEKDTTVISTKTGKSYRIDDNIQCQDSGVFMYTCKQPNCQKQIVLPAKTTFVSAIMTRQYYVFKLYFQKMFSDPNSDLAHKYRSTIAKHYELCHPEIVHRNLTFKDAYKIHLLSKCNKINNQDQFFSSNVEPLNVSLQKWISWIQPDLEKGERWEGNPATYTMSNGNASSSKTASNGSREADVTWELPSTYYQNKVKTVVANGTNSPIEALPTLIPLTSAVKLEKD